MELTEHPHWPAMSLASEDVVQGLYGLMVLHVVPDRALDTMSLQAFSSQITPDETDTQLQCFPGNRVALTPDTERGEQHRETLPAVFSTLRPLPRDLGVTSQATVFLPFSQRQ